VDAAVDTQAACPYAAGGQPPRRDQNGLARAAEHDSVRGEHGRDANLAAGLLDELPDAFGRFLHEHHRAGSGGVARDRHPRPREIECLLLRERAGGVPGHQLADPVAERLRYRDVPRLELS